MLFVWKVSLFYANTEPLDFAKVLYVKSVLYSIAISLRCLIVAGISLHAHWYLVDYYYQGEISESHRFTKYILAFKTFHLITVVCFGGLLSLGFASIAVEYVPTVNF